MKNTKLLSFIISSVMMLSASVTSVSADEDSEPIYKASITFGDSIAVSHDDYQSFASLTSEYIMEKYGIDCGIYETENGRTSAEILNSIKTNEALISPKAVYGKEYDGDYKELSVFISAGGNDFLDFFEETVNPYLEEGDTLLTLTPEKTEALKNKISADSSNFTSKLSSSDKVTETALANASEMVSYIRNVQPEAEIYFLEVYNPFERFSESGDETLEIISTAADNILKKFNSGLSELKDAHIVPVFSAIKEHPDDFIIENDIHPTLAGQVRISQLLLNDITKEDDKTILSNMKNGMNGFIPVLSVSEYDSLPEYMKEGISDEPEVTEPIVTTTHDREPAINVSETTAVTTSVSSTVTSSATSRVTSATSRVSAAPSSPKTSDRGISAVTVTGLFTAAAVCLMFRRKENK